MKKYSFIFFLTYASFLFCQPVIDGEFDGESTWGSPIHTADGSDGWAGANAKKIYKTFDASYVYFGAEVKASSWQSWAFIINTKTGGGGYDSWSRAIDYNHSNKPDYIIRGTFGGYAEKHVWNGSSWDGIGTGLAASEFGENITGSDQNGWVEARFPRSILIEISGDIQFYITGDNNEHGSFDACPDDNNATSWDHSSSRISLSNYATGNIFPVELSSFKAYLIDNKVNLQWVTATEINNFGFAVERSMDNALWSQISFVNGAGNSNSIKQYSFADKNFPNANTIYYRLKQLDNDGKFSYSDVVSVSLTNITSYSLEQNYPNPFNPVTIISFAVPKTGNVKLTVYNALGQLVADILNEVKDAGIHKVEFNAGNLSSGLYYYKLEGESFVQARKMMILK